MNDLAESYYKSKDYTKARYWYEKSAQKGNLVALHMLGKFYQYGFGVESNLETAKKYYEKSCNGCKVTVGKKSLKMK